MLGRTCVLTLLISISGNCLAQRAIDFTSGVLPASGSIALPVHVAESDAAGLGDTVSTINARTSGALQRAMASAGFTGAAGQKLTLYEIAPYSRIDLIGVGEERLNRVDAENFGGNLAQLNGGSADTPLQILWSGINADPDASAARVALGFSFGDYRFDRYQQSRLDPGARGSVMIFSADQNAAETYRQDLAYLAEAVSLARNLSSEPANVIYPESFVERVSEQFKGLRKVKIKVLDEKDLRRLGMGAHLGVGRGSERPPRLLIIEYMGGGDERPLVLAGKGITFDTGGISIKDKDGMWRMKADMTGAAVVSATVLAAARREAPVNIVALAALAENMPSGSAIRPGDVLQAMSGKTIEIKSTDAEGRLVLADAVFYGQLEYRPDVLIDVATLTGSVGRALGEYYAGLFGNDETLMEQLTAAGALAGEEVWRLPLDERYYRQNLSDIADVRNGGSGNAGASNGAAFIGFFIAPEQTWAHLDIASVDYIDVAWPTKPVGYSGWGVRLLDQYIRDYRQ